MENEQAEQRLLNTIQEGQLCRDFLRHDAFKIWKRELDAKMGDLKNKWFTASDVEGEKIKLRAQVYNEMLDILKMKVLQGEASAKMLNAAREENQDL